MRDLLRPFLDATLFKLLKKRAQKIVPPQFPRQFDSPFECPSIDFFSKPQRCLREDKVIDARIMTRLQCVMVLRSWRLKVTNFQIVRILNVLADGLTTLLNHRA